MKELIKEFLDHMRFERRLTDNTYSAYQQDLHTFQIFIDKHYDGELVAVSKFNKMMKEYALYVQEIYRSSTMARRLSTCMQFLQFVASEKFQCIYTPDKPKIPHHFTYTPFLENTHFDKIRRSLTKSKDMRTLAIIEILYSTGMRISELLEMKVEEVAEIFKTKNKLIVGKGAIVRYVFFSDIALTALEKFHSTLKYSSGFLFSANNGMTHLTRQRVFQLLKKISRCAGVNPDLVFAHAFRHRMLTNMVRGGADLVSVQKIAGHRQINTTARYTHIEDHLSKDVQEHHPVAKKVKAS